MTVTKYKVRSLIIKPMLTVIRPTVLTVMM